MKHLRLPAILTVLLVLLLMLAACQAPYEGQVICEVKEGYAILTPSGLCGEYTVRLERPDAGEGTVYYYASLTEGTLTATLAEEGREMQPLFAAACGRTEGGSAGYLEGSGEVTVTLRADEPATGEVILAFSPEVLTAIRKEPVLHTHTYRYEITDLTHTAFFTCGCPERQTPAPEAHFDEDGDLLCDCCRTAVQPPHEHSGEWELDETAHRYVYDCGCPSPETKEPHTDADTDLICDICHYYLPGYGRLYLCTLAGAEWLSALTAEEVTAVTWSLSPSGPGEREQATMAEASAIAELLAAYRTLEVRPALGEEEEAAALGDTVTLSFLLSDGSERTLPLHGGCYREPGGALFSLYDLPKPKPAP